jgi:hypothetical protein
VEGTPAATAWADLDRLAIAKPRPDGRVTLVVRDDRTPDQIAETPSSLSVLIAACRVLRGQRVIAERHGGRGIVIYSCRQPPPDFLTEAVTAAGGVVFDGARERTRPAYALTVLLDAAFIDLASVVRRRLGARSFAEALAALEADVRSRKISVGDAAAYWGAVLELTALTGELARSSGMPGRWDAATGTRLPLALDLGGGKALSPGALAQAIVEGTPGSLRQLITLGTLHDATAGVPFPLLCHRTAVPIDRLSWTPLVSDGDAGEHPDVPVIVWVEDLGEGIRFPTDRGAASDALRARAVKNLDRLAVEITEVPLPFARVAVVTGDYFAAEMLLHPPTMARVAQALGGAETLLVGVPARGYLLAVDAATADLDDDLRAAFVGMVEREHQRATERDRISAQVLFYRDGDVTAARSG